MVRLLYANSGSILLNPQADYTVLSETPFSQAEKKKKKRVKNNQSQRGIKINKHDDTYKVANTDFDTH